MADVYGNLGNEPIELNNAATEATLKSLLAAVQSQNKQGGKEQKVDVAKFEKALNNLVQALNKTTSSTQDQSKQQRQSTKLVKDESRARNQSVDTIEDETQARRQSIREQRKATEGSKVSAKGVIGALDTVASGLTGVARDIQQMGNSISGATGIFSGFAKQIPVVGTVIGSFMDMIAGAIENTQKSFQTAASIGANFGGSIQDMVDSATNVGLTFDQFSSIIQENGEAVAFLGRSSAEGAKRFAQVGTSIRKSGLQDQLAYLGYNTEQINEGMLNYTVLLQRAGVNVRNLAPAELGQLTGDYLKNLDAVSKLTGQSRKELEQQRLERQKDIRVRATQTRLTGEGARENYQAMMDIARSQGPEAEKAFRDLFFGLDPGPEARAALAFAPEAAQAIQRMGLEATRTGNFTKEGADVVLRSLVSSGQALEKNKRQLDVLAVRQDDFGGTITSMMNFSALAGKSFADLTTEQQEEIRKRQAAAKAADPAEILRTQQELARSSNEMNKVLLEFSKPLTDLLRSFGTILADDLLPWIGKLPEKIKELWKKIKDFLDDPLKGTGKIFGMLVDKIKEGVSLGVDYLVKMATEIGEKISTGFVNNLPDWLKEWMGVEGQSDAEKERDALQKRVDRLQARPQTKDSEESKKLQARIAELNNTIATEKTLKESPEEKRLNDRIKSLESEIKNLAITSGEFGDLSNNDDLIKIKEHELTQLKADLAKAEQDRKTPILPEVVVTAEVPTEPAKITVDLANRGEAGSRELALQEEVERLRDRELQYQEHSIKIGQELLRAKDKKDQAAIDQLTKEKEEKDKLLNETRAQLDNSTKDLYNIQKDKNKPQPIQPTQGVTPSTSVGGSLLHDEAGDTSTDNLAKTNKELTNTLRTTTQEQVDAERKKLIDEELERKNQARIEKERFERQQRATAALTTATQDNTKETKAASACELDYSSPQALFNSFATMMGVGGSGAPGTGVTGRMAGAIPPSVTGEDEMFNRVGPSTTVTGAPLPSGVKGMLEQISRGEGTSDEQARKRGLASGYDVSLGYGAYGGGPKKPLSQMTISEVKEYQKAMLADPKNKWNSSAVGKYQIVGTTLKSLQKELGFKDTDVFDQEMQDKLGEALLKRRGLNKYTSGRMSGEQFQLGLSQEWASIADPRTGKGYYGNQQTAHTTDAMIKNAMAGLFKPEEPKPTEVASNKFQESKQALEKQATEIFSKSGPSIKTLFERKDDLEIARKEAANEIQAALASGNQETIDAARAKGQDISNQIAANREEINKYSPDERRLAAAQLRERNEKLSPNLAEPKDKLLDNELTALQGKVDSFHPQLREAALAAYSDGLPFSATNPSYQPSLSSVDTIRNQLASVNMPAGQTTPNVPGAAAPAAGNAGTTSNLASLMEDLNSSIRQLVTLQNQQVDTSRRILTATKGNSTDLMRSVT